MTEWCTVGHCTVVGQSCGYIVVFMLSGSHLGLRVIGFWGVYAPGGRMQLTGFRCWNLEA